MNTPPDTAIPNRSARIRQFAGLARNAAIEVLADYLAGLSP